MTERLRPGIALAGALAAAAASALVGAPNAHAKAERVANWSYERVWPAAVRFLRIDEGREIVEKDADAGYVIFKVAEDGKEFEGALEVVRIEVDRRPSVRLVLRIEDRPSYMEEGTLRRMLSKLREELGPPPPPPPPPKPEKEEKPADKQG
jgi:hypothetical protein